MKRESSNRLDVALCLMVVAALIPVGAARRAAASPAAGPTDLVGRWDASITLKGVVIPFRLEIAGEGASLTGILFNGDEKQTTTSATVEEGRLVLSFDHYLTRIVAAPRDGRLEGQVEGRFERERYLSALPFEAKRYSEPVSASDAPVIDGLWEIPHETSKGEKAWRFIVHQKGAAVSAAILRVDGDTGSLTGTWREGRFVLSHFDAGRPLVLEVTPATDGTLSLALNGASAPEQHLTAYRPRQARAEGRPEPADFAAHTQVKDPDAVFGFTFPDLEGNLVSSRDHRYQNKVVLAVITGTWCPNCHDEAQYLVKLHERYRDQGLEIVALDFEEPEQQDGLARPRAFVKKYRVKYPYLIAGAPVELGEKVPQLVNLNSWPTTVFVGRDGRVKRVHAGFAGPASGEFHLELEKEFTSTIESLLSQNVAAAPASAH